MNDAHDNALDDRAALKAHHARQAIEATVENRSYWIDHADIGELQARLNDGGLSPRWEDLMVRRMAELKRRRGEYAALFSDVEEES